MATPARQLADPPRPQQLGPPAPRLVRGNSRLALLLGVLFVYVAVLGVLMDALPYRDWAPLWVVPLLGVLGVPLLRRAARGEPDPFVRRLLWIALGVKLVAAIVNYAVQYIVYKGVVDASNFNRYGSALSDSWRSGHFSLAPLDGVAGGFGTHALQFLTGVFYTVFGTSELAMFFVFSWLGFWGMYFFYRAAVIALPSLNRRRYAVLIFFWPSLVFWSSALGKDSWVFFLLGLASYGLARALERMRGGWALVVLAALGITPVRADITLLFVPCAVIGYYVARLQRRRLEPVRERYRMRDAVQLCALAVLVIATVVAFKAFFHLDSFSPSSFAKVLKQASVGSQEGHATYSGSFGPVNILEVLFRPLPFQVDDATAAVVSLEGLALLWLLVTSWGRLRTGIKLAAKNGYAAFCLSYSIVFIIAFSAIINAGTLDRERIAGLPMLFVLLSLTPSSRYARSLPGRMVRSRPYARAGAALEPPGSE
jgi:hypothetical protein